MFETIKLISKAIKGGYKMGKNGGIEKYLISKIERNDYEEKINDNTYILTDDDVIIGCGFRYAAAVACPKQNETVFAIIVEKAAKKLNINDFIVAHEMGHIENEFKMGITIIERNLMSEYAADEYAAKEIGLEKAIESLKVIASQKGVEKDEVELRIKHLNFIKSMIDDYKSRIDLYEKELKEAKEDLEDTKNNNLVSEETKRLCIKTSISLINTIEKNLDNMKDKIKMYGC